MSYFTSADDYKQFYELSGNKASTSDDYSHQDTVATGSVGANCGQDQDCGDMLYCVNGICSSNNPSQGIVQPPSSGVVQPPIERFKLNKNTGRFEPFGYSGRW